MKYVNKIDTTNLTLIQNRVFKSRQQALDFMKEDKKNRVFRDMNDYTSKSMGMRWQVLVFSPKQIQNTNKKRKKNPRITKADIVRQIVVEMQDNHRPKNIIQFIIDTVGLKYRAASTYYYNAKRDLKEQI